MRRSTTTYRVFSRRTYLLPAGRARSSRLTPLLQAPKVVRLFAAKHRNIASDFKANIAGTGIRGVVARGLAGLGGVATRGVVDIGGATTRGIVGIGGATTRGIVSISGASTR